VIAPTERHLEDWICENLNLFGEAYEAFDQFPGEGNEDQYHWIDEDHFILPYVERIVCRQVAFPHGIPDLIGLDLVNENVRVIELKKGPITLEAVGQCARYMYDLRKIYGLDSCTSPFSDLSHDLWFRFTDTRVLSPMVQGMVVGSQLPDRNVEALARLVGIEIVSYDLQPDGMYVFSAVPHNDIITFRDEYCQLPADERLCLFEALGEVVTNMVRFGGHNE
jgi:hypothetical protein